MSDKASGMHFSAKEYAQFEKQQDSLMHFAYDIVNAPEPSQRFRADSFFIRMLVRSLKIPNSFYFPFDSSANHFEIICTGQQFPHIHLADKERCICLFFQRGAIQMRTADGSLKLIPLHDVSMFTNKPEDSVREPNNWIGAIYYRIIQKNVNGKNIYTLLGFDDFTINSNKKWMDVLTFNELRDNRCLAVRIFRLKMIPPKHQKNRFTVFIIEYKKEATTTFNYDSSMNMIIYDHLISESEEPNRKETYVPDGDYEGFTWQNGQWLHVTKVFTATLQEGQFPDREKNTERCGWG